MAGRKGGLGKGLDVLFEDNSTSVAGEAVMTLRISEIEPNKGQPRKDFDESSLADLADSIRQHGVIQPLLVRSLASGGYQLVAGERRWRAARMAGLTEVPVVVREMSEQETMEIALIENLQREDLNPVEESLGYQTLAEQYQMTQEQIAKSVGKSRPVIANALRLLHLPQKVLEKLRREELSAGHARALLAIEDSKQVEELADRIVKQQLTVREVEKLVSLLKEPPKARQTPSFQELSREQFFKEMELAATEEFGRKIQISRKSKKEKGMLQIEFFNREDLQQIVQRLGQIFSDGSQ